MAKSKLSSIAQAQLKVAVMFVMIVSIGAAATPLFTGLL